MRSTRERIEMDRFPSGSLAVFHVWKRRRGRGETVSKEHGEGAASGERGRSGKPSNARHRRGRSEVEEESLVRAAET